MIFQDEDPLLNSMRLLYGLLNFRIQCLSWASIVNAFETVFMEWMVNSRNIERMEPNSLINNITSTCIGSIHFEVIG